MTISSVTTRNERFLTGFFAALALCGFADAVITAGYGIVAGSLIGFCLGLLFAFLGRKRPVVQNYKNEHFGLHFSLGILTGSGSATVILLILASVF